MEREERRWKGESKGKEYKLQRKVQDRRNWRRIKGDGYKELEIKGNRKLKVMAREGERKADGDGRTYKQPIRATKNSKCRFYFFYLISWRIQKITNRKKL